MSTFFLEDVSHRLPLPTVIVIKTAAFQNTLVVSWLCSGSLTCTRAPSACNRIAFKSIEMGRCGHLGRGMWSLTVTILGAQLLASLTVAGGSYQIGRAHV